MKTNLLSKPLSATLAILITTTKAFPAIVHDGKKEHSSMKEQTAEYMKLKGRKDHMCSMQMHEKMIKYITRSVTSILIVLAASISVSANGDAVKGKKVFSKCRACHTLKPGRNMVGPSLACIMGKEAGKAEKFRYSKVMLESGWTWDEATMTNYLAKPKTALKGTKMAFVGLKKPEDIENLIAYLKEN